jgi:hypothetical protein
MKQEVAAVGASDNGDSQPDGVDATESPSYLRRADLMTDQADQVYEQILQEARWPAGEPDTECVCTVSREMTRHRVKAC